MSTGTYEGTSIPAEMRAIFASAPWKHALFTTYALSLSYFESEVLRPLIRAGCDDIWLVADAEGYRASLLERRSTHVGHEYRLIPVALPHGVFHAKCIYLAADEEDLLLIGSGNVTFGGHGRNAEVFEALRPDVAAAAFEEFALFLESIGTRPDIRLARSDWIDEFAARARRAAGRGVDIEGSPTVRLVHSLEVPIAEQLRALLETYGPCAEATIMSPYHDPDGAAVRQLLEQIDAPRGAVAVTASGESPFPFAAAGAWDRPVTPVRPRQTEKRFVHAKWYEFSLRQDALLLTGSINATRKALTTTDNVELGVLRSVGRNGRPIDWAPTAMPVFVAQEPLSSGLGSHEIAYASFDCTEPDRLSGQLITLLSPAGQWQVRLIQADGGSVSHAVEVNEEGRFGFRDKTLEAFSQAPAVQIVMSMGERHARGWVLNDMLLGMSARRRLTAGALARLMRRDATDDDIQALLDYLSIHAEQHLRLFSLPIAGYGRDQNESRSEQTVSVHIDELAPLAHAVGAAPAPSGSGPERHDQFHAAMARLRRILLGHGRESRKALNSGSDAGLAEDEGEARGSRTPEQIAEALGLSDFELAISSMVEEARDRPEVRDGLLVVLLEVSMDVRLYRLADQDGAHEFLSGWFFKACRLSHTDPGNRTALQQHVLTSAAVLYALARDADTCALLATELHDALERYYKDPVDRAHAMRCLISDPQIGFAAVLLGNSEGVDLAAALEKILTTRTRRQQLEDALVLAERGEAVPAGWEVFRSPLGKKLWAALNCPNPQKRVRRSPRGLRGCAFDFIAFATQAAAQHDRERIGLCVQCKRFTVNTTP